ncbi:hypothetical protein P4O66_006547, partial [Electrophorus voltai]
LTWDTMAQVTVWLTLLGVLFICVIADPSKKQLIKNSIFLFCPPSQEQDVDIYSFHINSTVTSRYAITVITSRVANRLNSSKEVHFHVKIPKNAFISKFRMTIEAKTYDGVVKQKEEAQQQYNQAVSRGESAGMVSSVGRTLEDFKTSVTVAAFSKVTFELTYDELLKRRLGKYKLLINAQPMQPVADFKIDVYIHESSSISFMDVAGGLSTDELTKAITISQSDQKMWVSFYPTREQQTKCKSCSKNGLNGDLLIIYDVERPKPSGELQASNGYFVHYFAPMNIQRIPKNVVFVIDRSGSMHGRKMHQTRLAMLKILGDLNGDDYFGLITFDSFIDVWKPELLQATEMNLKAAKAFVREIQDQGYTDINAAVLKGVEIINSHPREGSASILILLTDGDPTAVWVGNCASSTLTLSTGTPQGCVLSPLLYSLYTYDCTATSSSTIIVKFADDTDVMGLILDNDERAYLEEIKHLENWCQENTLLLNISKTKELIVDCSKKQERHYQPVRISGTIVERVDSFRYLGVHISQDLSWSRHTISLAKKARQRLYHLRRLRDFRLPSKVLRNFYTCTIESILTGNITVWFGNSTKQHRQTLQRVVRSAERITHTELPDLQPIYYKRCQTKARRIVKDPTHPNNRLFSLLSLDRALSTISLRVILCEINKEIIQANVKGAIKGKFPLYCLGFGFDVNFDFLEKMALENNGVARRIYEDSDADLQLQGFYSEVATPLLTDVQMNYIGAGNLTQTSFSQYYNGSEIIVAGQITNNSLETFQTEVIAISKSHNVTYQDSVSMKDLMGISSQNENFIQRLWAYLSVKQLLEKEVTLKGEEKEAVKKEALALSLKYKFVTTLTSMVVTKPQGEETQIAHKPKEGKQQHTHHSLQHALAYIPPQSK